jgi:hypothetical protein
MLILSTTGCGFNYFHNVETLTTYKNVKINYDGDNLIISNDSINKIDLGRGNKI